jgi:hypothetical protein
MAPELEGAPDAVNLFEVPAATRSPRPGRDDERVRACPTGCGARGRLTTKNSNGNAGTACARQPCRTVSCTGCDAANTCRSRWCRGRHWHPCHRVPAGARRPGTRRVVGDAGLSSRSRSPSSRFASSSSSSGREAPGFAPEAGRIAACGGCRGTENPQGVHPSDRSCTSSCTK